MYSNLATEMISPSWTTLNASFADAASPLKLIDLSDDNMYSFPKSTGDDARDALGVFRYVVLTCNKPDGFAALYAELDLIEPPKTEPFLEFRNDRGLVLDGVSVPNVRLYVPEPFIASPNFHIEDI